MAQIDPNRYQPHNSPHDRYDKAAERSIVTYKPGPLVYNKTNPEPAKKPDLDESPKKEKETKEKEKTEKTKESLAQIDPNRYKPRNSPWDRYDLSSDRQAKAGALRRK